MNRNIKSLIVASGLALGINGCATEPYVKMSGTVINDSYRGGFNWSYTINVETEQGRRVLKIDNSHDDVVSLDALIEPGDKLEFYVPLSKVRDLFYNLSAKQVIDLSKNKD